MAANAGTKLHGKNGAIYIGGPKGAGGTKVAAKSQWDLNLARDYVEVTTFGDTNKTYKAGLKDISGSFNGLLDVSGDLMVNNSSIDDVVMYLYADDGVSPILIAYGKALIDSSITASNTDAVRVSGNFRAANSWAVFSDGSLSV
jgi:hypothetical protein